MTRTTHTTLALLTSLTLCACATAPATVVERTPEVAPVQTPPAPAPPALTPAPDLMLASHDGRPVSLTDYRGRWLILHAFPPSDLPECVCDANIYTLVLEQLSQLPAAVLGVSSPSTRELHRLREKYGLGITLLSDPDGEARRQVEAAAGLETARWSVLIDPEGFLVKTLDCTRPRGHVPAMRGALLGSISRDEVREQTTLPASQDVARQRKP